MCHRLVFDDSFERNYVGRTMQNLSTYKGISQSNNKTLYFQNDFVEYFNRN